VSRDTYLFAYMENTVYLCIVMTIIIKKGTDKKTLAAIWDKLKEITSTTNGLDSNKFCGVLKLEKDALAIQKEMRDEW